MRILIVHTYYQLRGGEDVVFEQEAALLSQVHDVKKLVFRNKSGYQGLVQFLLSIWNVFSAAKLEKEINLFKPDLIHIHNLHFAASPIVIRKAKKRGIPVVMTLHNYRLICPSGTLLYNGVLLDSSVRSSFPWEATGKGAYRGSILQTFWLGFTTWIHRKIGTWKMVDRFLVLTDFGKEIFLESRLGIPSGRLYVKPNFVSKRSEQMDVKRNDSFLFIGRLSVEKGISVLLEAFENTDMKLTIAGDGPELEKVLACLERCPNINYVGKLSATEVYSEMMQCSALVFPSIWYEGMPMTILEAFAAGTTVIASNLGGMGAMIENGVNGLTFEHGNAKDLLSKLLFWTGLSDEDKELYRVNALKEFHTKYTGEVNMDQLNSCYNEILSDR